MPINANEWNALVDRIADGMCIPFLGAGTSLGAGAPSAASLSKKLAVLCEYPGRDPYDFLKVAQYYRMKVDDYAPRREIIKVLRDKNIRPSPAHEALAALPFRYIITTNYDNLIERALIGQGKEPTVMTYKVGSNVTEIATPPTEDKPIVYKIHGSMDDPQSMIVTEDDMVNWMAAVLMADPPIPQAIRTLFKESVLFIGYALTDWNIRVLLRAMRGREPPKLCVSIQKQPDDPLDATLWNELVAHLQKNELRCYSMDATEFIAELKNRYDTVAGVVR
jgi:NAD-dependent SIR2 family protein deacetylase